MSRWPNEERRTSLPPARAAIACLGASVVADSCLSTRNVDRPKGILHGGVHALVCLRAVRGALIADDEYLQQT